MDESTFRLNVSTFCGIPWVESVTSKTSQVEVTRGQLAYLSCRRCRRVPLRRG